MDVDTRPAHPASIGGHETACSVVCPIAGKVVLGPTCGDPALALATRTRVAVTLPGAEPNERLAASATCRLQTDLFRNGRKISTRFVYGPSVAGRLSDFA